MSHEKRKYRLAVVSPFLDKRHGSERIMVEWLSHLPGNFDIHIYSQRIEDMDAAKFTWHRIPKLPGPHLLNFVWWVIAIRLWVGCGRRFRGLQHDLLFSSGADWPGADVTCVHIVFREYVRQVRSQMSFHANSFSHWPILFHRRLYYAFVMWLERLAYVNRNTTLVVNSRKTAGEIERLYHRTDRIPVLYLGLDHSVFNPATRKALRDNARAELGIPKNEFVLILVGNDWRNKGVPVLLESLEQLQDLPISLMIVSREDLSVCRKLVSEEGLKSKVRFVPPRNDIEFYYAAADVYAGPSLQDSYAMPPAEAMACGMPVIVSASAGVSEIVTNGVDGLVLGNPKDAQTLVAMIRRVYEDEEFRTRLGNKAAETTSRYTWDRNGKDLSAIFEEVLRRKARPAAERLTQER